MFNLFPPLKIVPFEIMWKKYCTVGQTTDSNTIQSMRSACRVLKAKNTHGEDM
jgi:hypothetical protein